MQTVTMDDENDSEQIFCNLDLERQFLRYVALVDYSESLGVSPDVFYGRNERIVFDVLKKVRGTFPPETLNEVVLSNVDESHFDSVERTLDDIVSAPVLDNREAARSILNMLHDLNSQRNLTQLSLDVRELVNDSKIPEAYKKIRLSLVGDQTLRFTVGGYIEDFPERRAKLEIRRKEGGDTHLIPTGLNDFDAQTGGLKKGEVGVLIAKTGGGKSLAKLNFAVAAWMQGFNVVHIGLEMTKDENQTRMDTLLTEIPTRDFRTASLKQSDMDVWDQTIEYYKGVNTGYLQFVGGRSLSIQEIFAAVDGVELRRGPVDLLVLDHILLVRRDGKMDFHMKQWENFQDLSDWAKDRQVGVWTSGQVTDEGYKRKGGMRTTDVKYGRAIGELAQIVLALYQSEIDTVTGDYKVKVIKGRDIKLNTVIDIQPDMDHMVLDTISFREWPKRRTFGGA